jgi:integrase
MLTTTLKPLCEGVQRISLHPGCNVSCGTTIRRAPGTSPHRPGRMLERASVNEIVNQFVTPQELSDYSGKHAHSWLTSVSRSSTASISMRNEVEPKYRLFDMKVLETRPEHFLRVLEKGTVSTKVFLRRIHNFALDLTWLPWPILPKKQWPPVTYSEKRAITLKEHQALIAAERNPERKAFYQLCWHLGGSQGDVASLKAEDIDWNENAIAHARKKTGEVSVARLGAEAIAILKKLPLTGPLFPNMTLMRASDRATEFKRLWRRAGVEGVTLHSYRYAWAERARICGMPERFAQEVLGHNSKAVTRFYARKARVEVPALEEYEKQGRVVRASFNQTDSSDVQAGKAR